MLSNCRVWAEVFKAEIIVHLCSSVEHYVTIDYCVSTRDGRPAPRGALPAGRGGFPAPPRTVGRGGFPAPPRTVGRGGLPAPTHPVKIIKTAGKLRGKIKA